MYAIRFTQHKPGVGTYAVRLLGETIYEGTFAECQRFVRENGRIT